MDEDDSPTTRPSVATADAAGGTERESTIDRTATGASPDRQAASVAFTLSGIKRGYVACIPVALGVAGYGIVFGMLARRAGLSVAEATLMSATVLAGAAQLIAVKLWPTATATTVVVTTLLVNLRYLLMSASLHPWLSRLTTGQAYLSAFFTADENWALTIDELKSGSTDGAFLLGSGLTIWSFWVVATVFGATTGGVIESPARFGLDFVFVAVFVGLAVSLWDGPSDAPPWLAAVAASVVGYGLLPGKWYILLGALAGCLTGVVRYDE